MNYARAVENADSLPSQVVNIALIYASSANVRTTPQAHQCAQGERISPRLYALRLRCVYCRRRPEGRGSGKKDNSLNTRKASLRRQTLSSAMNAPINSNKSRSLLAASLYVYLGYAEPRNSLGQRTFIPVYSQREMFGEQYWRLSIRHCINSVALQYLSVLCDPAFSLGF